MSALLELRGLSAGYGGVAVVHDLDLTVAAGEVVALVGANGAGKTTTLLTVSGLLPPLGGALTVLGTTSASEGGRFGRRPGPTSWSLARRGLAHVLEDRSLFFDLTAAENLRLGRRRRGPGIDLDRVLSWFPALVPVLDRRAGVLSGGEQQMLALARAVVARPRMLLVDELSLGLAPRIVEDLLPVVRTIAEETDAGVVLVEQHVDLALAVADRALLLSGGRAVWSGEAGALAADRELLERGYLGTTPG